MYRYLSTDFLARTILAFSKSIVGHLREDSLRRGNVPGTPDQRDYHALIKLAQLLRIMMGAIRVQVRKFPCVLYLEGGGHVTQVTVRHEGIPSGFGPCRACNGRHPTREIVEKRLGLVDYISYLALYNQSLMSDPVIGFVQFQDSWQPLAEVWFSSFAARNLDVFSRRCGKVESGLLVHRK